MGIFPPPDSCDVGAARVWLVAVMVAMSLASLALLAQSVLLWRREARLHVAWWGRLPLVLPVVWAGVCGFVAAQAFIYYGAQRDLPPCPPGRMCISHRGCFPIPPLGGGAQLILIIAVMLILGWLALSRLPRLASGTTA